MHPACVIWLPELSFRNSELMDGIEGLNKIKLERLKLRCHVCETVHGACVQCNTEGCFASIHVLCGHRKFLMRMVAAGDEVLTAQHCTKHAPPLPPEYASVPVEAREQVLPAVPAPRAACRVPLLMCRGDLLPEARRDDADARVCRRRDRPSPTRATWGKCAASARRPKRCWPTCRAWWLPRALALRGARPASVGRGVLRAMEQARARWCRTRLKRARILPRPTILGRAY